MIKSLYDIEIETITGEKLKLESYRGQVLLITNTASKCGFTRQYEGLQSLYERFQDKGFQVLGFPANDFMFQEPGTNEEIAAFCKQNYGVTFPMFAKIVVKGEGQHPLYQYLTNKETNPEHAGPITWNFNKFLIGRNGEILARIDTRTPPEDLGLIRTLEVALESKPPIAVP